MTQRTCRMCAYAERVRDGRRTLLICANTLQAPGRLRLVPMDGTCRNMRPRRKRAGRPARSASDADEIRYIALTKGLFAIVDARDYAKLARHKWCASLCNRRFYAYRHTYQSGSISMHRQIMRPPKGMVVDHIDGNALNNSRTNLRVCTTLQNGHNSGPSGRTSSFKGVSYVHALQKWAAAICIKKRSVHIGFFDDEHEAARAYDRHALKRFGEYAWLNFPDQANPAHQEREGRT